jgi:tRNA nucleotidyltransferase/poly(A) polymerase
MKYIKPRKLVKENKKVEFDIPDIIWDLNKIFNDNGYKLYIVGGAVRDFLTGDTPKDFDLSTDAVPDEVMKILQPFYPVKPQGEAFGVVVVNPPGYEEMEIATFRVDKYDNINDKNPKVRIGDVTIEDDVLRRDLSINGLFYDLKTKKIIDLVGGRKDIDNKIVRMIGDPKQRIYEDPLRILRAIRAACRY